MASVPTIRLGEEALRDLGLSDIQVRSLTTLEVALCDNRDFGFLITRGAIVMAVQERIKELERIAKNFLEDPDEVVGIPHENAEHLP